MLLSLKALKYINVTLEYVDAQLPSNYISQFFLRDIPSFSYVNVDNFELIWRANLVHHEKTGYKSTNSIPRLARRHYVHEIKFKGSKIIAKAVESSHRAKSTVFGALFGSFGDPESISVSH